jgi:glycosyltransferase involved in cell wall biosynthesis
MNAIRQPPRLLMLTDTAILGPGGSERFLRNLLSRLSAAEYRIDVLQLSAPPSDGSRMASIDERSVRLLHRPIEALYAPPGLAAFGAVCRSVLRGDYDIVQSQHEKSDLINALLPRRARVRRISNRRDMGFQKSHRVRAVLRRANARFDRIIAPTRTILDALIAEENVDRARCRTIPNGVDTNRFHPAAADQRARLRDDLRCAHDECVIGCVASFTPVKQHRTLIEAFARLLYLHPRARLLLVGEGPLRGDVEQQIGQLGISERVDLLGARADVERILPALDIFTLASSTEGMSNAILEAQACALPVVATRVGGNPDLVRPHVNGLLVPAQAPAELAAALSALAAAPSQRAVLGRAAQQRVQDHYSLDAMSAGYARLYEELADER